MPTYVFKDTVTGEVFDKWMPMADREPYLTENPHIKQLPTLLNSGEVGDWQSKTDGGWNEVLRRVGNMPGSVVKPYK